MLDSLLNLMFRCQHKQLSRPITPPRRETYVVCLECGKQFAYDLKLMRIGPRISVAAGAAQHPTV